MHPTYNFASTASGSFLLNLLNQVFEIEKKATALPAGSTSIQRNVNRLRTLFEQDIPGNGAMAEGASGYSLTYHSPLGERYDETRTDCEATGTAGSSAENLVITEVIKPIVYLAGPGQPKAMVQRAVVVAASAGTAPESEPLSSSN